MFRTTRTVAATAACLVALGTLASPAHAAPATEPVTSADLAHGSAFTINGAPSSNRLTEVEKGSDVLFGMCQSKSLAEFSPISSLTGYFENSRGEAAGATSIGAWATTARAQAVQKSFAAQFDSCQKKMAGWGYKLIAPQTTRTMTLGTTGYWQGTAVLVTNQFRDVTGQRWIDARAIVRAGNRVALVSQSTRTAGVTSDSDIAQTARKAAEYLVEGKPLPVTSVIAENLAEPHVFVQPGKNSAMKTTMSERQASAPLAHCQTRSLEEYSPTESFQREYSDSVNDSVGSLSIASFGSTARAQSRHVTIAKQFDNCRQQFIQRGYTMVGKQTKRTIQIDGGSAVIVTNHWRAPGGKVVQDATAVIRTGSHVGILNYEGTFAKPQTDKAMATSATLAANYLR